MWIICYVTLDFFWGVGVWERCCYTRSYQPMSVCNDVEYKCIWSLTGAADIWTIQSLFVQNSCHGGNSVQMPYKFSEVINMQFYAVLLHFAKCGDLRVKVWFSTKIGLKKSEFEQKVLQNCIISPKIPKSYFQKTRVVALLIPRLRARPKCWLYSA